MKICDSKMLYMQFSLFILKCKLVSCPCPYITDNLICFIMLLQWYVVTMHDVNHWETIRLDQPTHGLSGSNSNRTTAECVTSPESTVSLLLFFNGWFIWKKEFSNKYIRQRDSPYNKTLVCGFFIVTWDRLLLSFKGG